MLPYDPPRIDAAPSIHHKSSGHPRHCRGTVRTPAWPADKLHPTKSAAISRGMPTRALTRQKPAPRRHRQQGSSSIVRPRNSAQLAKQSDPAPHISQNYLPRRIHTALPTLPNLRPQAPQKQKWRKHNRSLTSNSSIAEGPKVFKLHYPGFSCFAMMVCPRYPQLLINNAQKR